MPRNYPKHQMSLKLCQQQEEAKEEIKKKDANCPKLHKSKSQAQAIISKLVKYVYLILNHFYNNQILVKNNWKIFKVNLLNTHGDIHNFGTNGTRINKKPMVLQKSTQKKHRIN
jgi:hypothetical protein